jgi:hypothetical protein
MRTRRINRSYAYRTLKTPDELYEGVEHGIMTAVKKVSDKFVILAYEESDKTVYAMGYFSNHFYAVASSTVGRTARCPYVLSYGACHIGGLRLWDC